MGCPSVQECSLKVRVGCAQSLFPRDSPLSRFRGVFPLSLGGLAGLPSVLVAAVFRVVGYRGLMMRVGFRLLSVAAGAAVVGAAMIATTAGARPASVNVCGMLTASQVKTIKVTPTSCTTEPTAVINGVHDYKSYWGAKPASAFAGHGSSLEVAVLPLSGAALSTRKTTTQQEIKTGLLKKVTGLGPLAGERTAANTTTVDFVKGSDAVDVVVSETPLPPLKAIIALAKKIAAKL
jgi:hypothetical protein